jgi:hypothetical protein
LRRIVLAGLDLLFRERLHWPGSLVEALLLRICVGLGKLELPRRPPGQLPDRCLDDPAPWLGPEGSPFVATTLFLASSGIDFYEHAREKCRGHV